jgi:Lysozyme like domain
VTKDDEHVLLAMLGIWVISKYTWQVVPALQQGGASFYDWVHDDGGHVKDLPGKQLTRRALLTLATQAGFPDPKLASAIALAESGGVTGAMLRNSHEYSVGLWQINTNVHPYTPEDMKDPYKNAAAAFKISKGGKDWKPWSTYKNLAYLKFKTGILA